MSSTLDKEAKMWITIKEYAARFSCSEQHVRNLIKAGRVEAKDISITGRHCWRIKVEE